MDQNTYRLERWIAFVLFLLFFLPFVANADEILYTDRFHAGEVKAKSGQHFLALACKDGECVLRPVAIKVTTEHDPFFDAEDETTGIRVTVAGLDDAFLFRSKRLSPGLVTPAAPLATELNPAAKPQTLVLGSKRWQIRYRCASAPDPDGLVACSLLLESGGVSQVLAEFPAYDDGGTPATLDFAQSIFFAGDLDHDGRLDLVANISADWHTWHPALFLSSAAKEGELVGLVAEMILNTGC